jgi:hypothetical protein
LNVLSDLVCQNVRPNNFLYEKYIHCLADSLRIHFGKLEKKKKKI